MWLYWLTVEKCIQVCHFFPWSVWNLQAKHKLLPLPNRCATQALSLFCSESHLDLRHTPLFTCFSELESSATKKMSQTSDSLPCLPQRCRTLPSYFTTPRLRGAGRIPPLITTKFGDKKFPRALPDSQWDIYFLNNALITCVCTFLK